MVALLVLALFTLAHGQTRTWTMIKVTADAECKVLGTRNPPEVLYENGICYNEYVPPYELSYKYSKNSLVTFGGYDCGTVSGRSQAFVRHVRSLFEWLLRAMCSPY